MTSRRDLLFLIAVSSLRPPQTLAQPAEKVWRVGLLVAGARTADGRAPAALRQAMQKLGYVEGTKVVYESRFAEGRTERLPGLAVELVKLKPDVIVAAGGLAAIAVQRATSTIPIVLAPAAGDAVALGLMASLARPGGNITGLTDESVQLSAKRMELLKQMLPKAGRIAVVWNAADDGMTLRYQAIERAARTLQIQVQPVQVRGPSDFDAAIDSMTRQRPDAIFLVADALTGMNRKRIIEFASSQRIPSMYEYSYYVKDGGLMSYGYSIDDAWAEAAGYVDRILRGANPAELAASQPMRYYLTVNRKSAASLGIDIPESVLVRSDEVVQ